MSLNQRRCAYANARGYPRAATEKEIPASSNLMLDIDFDDKNPSPTQLRGLEDYLKGEGASWYWDMGFMEPVMGFSGRGYHLFTGYDPVQVSDTPDIADRLRRFSLEFQQDHGGGLSNLGARTDTKVFDLRRMVKVYGTAKPGVKAVSRWYGGERQEDEALRAYLLGMPLAPALTPRQATTPAFGPKLVHAGGELPELFRHLLQQDDRLRDLWHGRGKNGGDDTSRSGYDFSVARRLMALGYRNLDDLATVLAARPDGAVRQSGKGDDYIRRTLANVLLR